LKILDAKGRIAAYGEAPPVRNREEFLSQVALPAHDFLASEEVKCEKNR
jgi:hypothetical protein